jgi:hypothetical protein
MTDETSESVLLAERDAHYARVERAPTYILLQGRVAVVEIFDRSPLIHRVDGYNKSHERDRTSHRGRVVAMGPPAETKRGVPIAPTFTVGDEVLFVFDKLSDRDGGHGSWTEDARRGQWPPTGEDVVWIAQEEVIGVFWDARSAAEYFFERLEEELRAIV